PAEGETGSLVTTRGYELLFSPGLDSQAWFHRELLLIAVIEDLYRRGWKPDGAAEGVSSLPTEPSLPDSDEGEGSIQGRSWWERSRRGGSVARPTTGTGTPTWPRVRARGLART